MNRMYAASISREELLGWLGGQYRPVAKRLAPSEIANITRQDIVLVWRDKPANDASTALIVVRDESLRDFYAFVGTYVSTYTPFSAFFRVITPNRLLDSMEADAHSQLNLPAAIGVAIAEAFVQARGKAKGASDLSLPAVLGTLSASLAMAVYRGYRPDQLKEITALWIRARQVGSDDDLALPPAKTLQVWTLIAQSMSPEPSVISGSDESARAIVAFLRTARSSNGAIAEQLYPLTARFPALGDTVLRMRRTREERVRVLSEAVKSLANSDGDSVLKEFLAGALVSLIGDGSFDFLPFATNLTRDFPGAALWFGISSSLQKGNDALTAANCLGRRAARDAFARWNVFDTPRDDVSIEEIEMSQRSDHGGSGLRGAGQSILSIELVPGVSAKVRASSSSRSDVHTAPAPSWKQDAEEMKELRYLLDRARYTLDRLSADARQPDMFDPGSRPYRRRR